jgi:hypothetical protein
VEPLPKRDRLVHTHAAESDDGKQRSQARTQRCHITMAHKAAHEVDRSAAQALRARAVRGLVTDAADALPRPSLIPIKTPPTGAPRRTGHRECHRKSHVERPCRAGPGAVFELTTNGRRKNEAVAKRLAEFTNHKLRGFSDSDIAAARRVCCATQRALTLRRFPSQRVRARSQLETDGHEKMG